VTGGGISRRSLATGLLATGLLAAGVLRGGEAAAQQNSARRLILAHSDAEEGHIWAARDGQSFGLAPDLVHAVVELRAGIAVEFKPMPWLRSLEAVRQGQADALLVVPLPDRMEWCLATAQPLLVLPRVIVFRDDHPARTILMAAGTLQDLFSFSYVHDRLDAVEVERARLLPRSVSGNSDEAVLRMLAAGRGDFTVMSAMKFQPGRSRLIDGQPLIARAMPSLGTVSSHLLIRRSLTGAAGMIARIDEEITRSLADGTITELLNRYPS
jgi:ABC-type amino acid transport substrate-binding protein